MQRATVQGRRAIHTFERITFANKKALVTAVVNCKTHNTTLLKQGISYCEGSSLNKKAEPGADSVSTNCAKPGYFPHHLCSPKHPFWGKWISYGSRSL